MDELIINERSSANHKQEKQVRKRRNKRKHKGTIFLILSIIVLVAVNGFLFSDIIRVGTEALEDSYANAYNSEREEAYQELYERYYELAEQQYHVSNRGSISIGNIKESAKLEVLKVSDVEYIIENSEDNTAGITSWLEVPGEGTYVVDLQSAEFIIDNERVHVTVRVPYPELTNVSIDYVNVNKLFFDNKIFNESYKVGEDLARRQLDNADMLIKQEFATNQNFYLTAQETAKRSIEYLIRQMNPDETDLTVDVEFF